MDLLPDHSAWCCKASRMKNRALLAAAIAANLASEYGEVMVSADLAAALKISPNALRLVLSRGGDLPRPAPLPGKGHRWLSADIADWLAERSGTAADGDDASGRLDVHTPELQRRRGRPRKTAAGDSAAVAGGAS